MNQKTRSTIVQGVHNQPVQVTIDRAGIVTVTLFSGQTLGIQLDDLERLTQEAEALWRKLEEQAAKDFNDDLVQALTKSQACAVYLDIPDQKRIEVSGQRGHNRYRVSLWAGGIEQDVYEGQLSDIRVICVMHYEAIRSMLIVHWKEVS